MAKTRTQEKAGSKSQAGTKPRNEPAFRCKLCGQDKPLSQMVVSTRFFPLITACRDCDK